MPSSGGLLSGKIAGDYFTKAIFKRIFAQRIQ
jgi:hypothetical protein